MITYRVQGDERIVLYWERGVPRILGRHSRVDCARIAALGQTVEELAYQGAVDLDLGPNILWAITRAYSSSLGYAQIPMNRITAIAWWRYQDSFLDEDGYPSDEWPEECHWSPSDIADTIRKLEECGLLTVERISQTNRRKGQGHANRYTLALPSVNIEAQSRTT